MRMLDEVEFNDERSGHPGTMLLGATDADEIAIEIDIVTARGLKFAVSLEDARRIAERLAEAANDVARGD